MSDEWWMVLGMMVVTFSMRYPVMAFLGRVSLPVWLVEMLSFVPVAVLTAIIVPTVLSQGLPSFGSLLSLDEPRVITAVVAVVVAALTRHLLLTIAVGLLLWAMILPH